MSSLSGHGKSVRIVVIGASHQGEVVVDILRRQPSRVDIVAILDSDIEGRFVGREVSGIPVADHIGSLPQLRGEVDGVVPAVGKGSERERIAAAASDAGIALISAIHPASSVAENVRIGPGSTIGAGAIVGVGAKIGRGVIINSGAIVEHHCRVADFVHVAPGANLAGGVQVGERAWIGIGATILEDVTVESDAMVGAASLVNRDVSPGTTVLGAPARPKDKGKTSEPG